MLRTLNSVRCNLVAGAVRRRQMRGDGHGALAIWTSILRRANALRPEGQKARIEGKHFSCGGIWQKAVLISSKGTCGNRKFYFGIL